MIVFLEFELIYIFNVIAKNRAQFEPIFFEVLVSDQSQLNAPPV